MADRSAQPLQREEPGRESADVATGRVLAVMAGMAAFVALTIGGVWLFFNFEVTRPTLPKAAPFQQPRLQTDNGADELARLERRQRAKLAGYGWIDRDAGLIRIPIDQAMRAIVARGDDGFRPLPEPQPAAAPGVGR